MKQLWISFLFFISPVWSTVNPLTKPNGELDPAAVTSHILQLEQTVADLQAQNQAQEQKQAAVLSSVLSKLASTSDELRKVKSDLQTLESDHNSTLLEFAAYKSQLQNVHTELNYTRENQNKTLSELKLLKKQLHRLNVTSDELMKAKEKLELLDIPSQRNITIALEHLKSEVTSVTRNLSNASWSEEKSKSFVTFEVRQLKNQISVHNNAVLRFDNVSLNIGDGYHADSGIFEVPVSGTYLFWVNVRALDSKNMFIHLVKEGTAIAHGYGALNPDAGSGVSFIYVTKIQQGDKLWFELNGSNNVQINGRSYSSYGAALLHAN